MAFVSEQDRGLFTVNFEEAHIGPGKYNINTKDLFKQSRGQAPFGSTALKSQINNPAISIKKEKQIVSPGPGQYSIPRAFSQEQSISTNNTSNITTVRSHKQTSAFRSKGQRFNSMETENPGPGAYSKLHTECTLIKKSVAQPKTAPFMSNQGRNQILGGNDIKNGFRIINDQRKVSSIPNGKQQILHEDFINNDKKNLDELSISINENTTGFGQKSQGAANWSKSGVDRFKYNRFNKDDQKILQNLGPGKYDINKQQQIRYKLNPSSNFASESVRSYQDQIQFNTNSELKAAIRKETGYKDQKPGPGQYDPIIEKEQNKKIYVHQFFGSTEERFKHDQINQVQVPGPGQYYKENNFVKQKNGNPRIQVSFQSTSVKQASGNSNNIQEVIQEVPGPGQYDITGIKSLKESVIKKYNSGYKGNFGSVQQRFRSSTQVTPGPGEYKNEILDNLKQKQISSVFSSQVPKTTQNSQLDDRNYNQQHGTIFNKIEKQKQYLDNLQKIGSFKPGFDSAVQRFEEKNNVKQNNFVTENSKNSTYGVGVLNEQTQNQLNQQIKHNRSLSHNNYNHKQQTTKQYKAAFADTSKKIDFIQNAQGPSPGQYNKQNQWNQRSYNIKFQAKKK